MEPQPHSAVRIEELLGHAAWVRGLAHSLVRDSGVADDLVQETWLAALRSPPPDGGATRAWLGRVVRNALFQRFRGESRRARREAAVEAPAAVETPDELVQRVEQQRMLADLVVELDEPFRSTVVLRYFDGHSAAEIARRQGVPAGTVRWRLKRGLDALRQRLDERNAGDRRAWCLALLPWLGDAPKPCGTGGLLAVAAQGVIAMSIWTKVMVVAGVLVTAGSLWTLSRIVGPSDPWDMEVASEPVAVEFQPLPRGTAREAIEAAQPRADERAVQEAAPAAVAVDATSARVRARFLDEAGAPVEGVEFLGANGGGAPSISGPDGVAELQRPGLRKSRGIDVVARHPEYVEARSEVRMEPGGAVSLGDVTLQRAGGIEVRVVDADGRPRTGCWVELGDVALSVGAAVEQRRALRARHRESPVTNADGRVVLRSVPAGFARVWAGGPDLLPECSGPVEVRVAQLSTGVELVLGPMPDDAVIEGLVQDPDGNPVEASVEYRYRSKGRSGSGNVHAGKDGRFRIHVNASLPHDLIFEPVRRRAGSAAGDEFGSVAREGVAPGTRDLVVRFREPRSVTLVVTGRGGAAVPNYTAVVLLDGRAVDILVCLSVADGTLRVPTRHAPAIVRIDAEGYEIAEVGPVLPEPATDRVEVELRPLPGVSGVVTAGGKPAAGARIDLLERVAAGRSAQRNDFPVRLGPTPVATGTAGPDGHFRITLRQSGSFVLLASMEGRATRELPPAEIDHETGLADLRVELGPGGVIEGRVRTPSGRGAAGVIVGISRGDGLGRTQRVGPDGRFRFEHLAPGPWQVARHDVEVVPGGGMSTVESGEPSPPMRWDCRVVEGETTVFDLQAAEAVPFRGRLLLGGEPPVAWTVGLHRVGAALRINSKPIPIPPDGSFVAPTDGPGAYTLYFGAPGDAGSRLSLTVPLELAPGSGDWQLDLPVGSLEGTLAAKWRGRADGLVLLYLWDGPDGAFAAAQLVPDADGGFVLPVVPTGPARIVWRDPADRHEVDPRDWETLVEVDVPPGRSETVELE